MSKDTVTIPNKPDHALLRRLCVERKGDNRISTFDLKQMHNTYVSIVEHYQKETDK